jgi:large subunit ribosomal protein L18
MSNTRDLRIKRKLHVRKTVSGTAEKPRLAVFRSNVHIYAQLIDDVNAKTLVAVSDKELEAENKTELAKKVGQLLAKEAKAKKIEKVVFDRAGYKFHGRVKALAEGAREGGMIF